YGLPGNIALERSTGRKDCSPFIVVLFEPARSAEPPHSSGSTGARAERTEPEAERVDTSLPASKVGSASAQPSGSSPACSRSSSAAPSGLAVRQAWKEVSHSARAAAPRSRT